MFKKKISVIFALSSVALTALAGCGSPENPNDDTTGGSTTIGKPDMMISLGSDYIAETKDSTYFAPQLVSSVDSGVPQYVSTKSKAIVESGDSYKLYAYGLPTGYSTGVTVYDGSGNKVEGIVASDGTVTAPQVSERTDYKIYLYGVSSDESKIIRKALEYTVVPDNSIAKGSYFDYSSLGTDERTKLTAIAENYVLDNGLAPLTYMVNSGYQLYNERVHSPFLDDNKYVPGYGFGLTDYGWIDAPLAAEQSEEFKMYLHDQLDASQDLGDFNYLASNSNAVSTLYGYVSQYYFNQFANEGADGYSYQPGLSRKAAPEAINPDSNGASTTWKVYLNVGTGSGEGVNSGYAYRTASGRFASFDKKPIKLEDYLTPFKLLATQSIGYYRGAEQAAESTLNRQIKGFAEFFAKTADATTLPTDKEIQEALGVKIDPSDNSITITFNGKVTPDYAEYQLNGLWCNPISEEFLTQLGGGNALEGAKRYGRNYESLSPLDTMLSVGPYYTTYYQSKKTIAFARNENWPIKQDMYGRELYQIEGVHLNVNSALSSNTNAYIEAFEAGTTDFSNIPEQYWDKYATDPRRKSVQGDRKSQYFINTYDKAFWDQRFPGQTNWTVKPILSNENFYKGLYVGIDRQSISDYYHYQPYYGVQEPNNKVSPKAEKTYNNTDEHKQVFKDQFGTALDDLSLWRNNAADYFELAIQEELEAGHYQLGTESNPTVVEFTLVMVDAADANYTEQQVFSSWENAFALAVTSHIGSDGKNDWVGPSGQPLIKLDVKSDRKSSSLSDTALQNEVLYNGVKAGRYDGEGVFFVSGNGLDTFNNFDKYRSDDSSGFTLNYSLDTSIPSADVYYDGKYWSFDSLWSAGNGGILLDQNGDETNFVTFTFDGSAANNISRDSSTGNITATIPVSILTEYVDPSSIQVEVDALVGGSETYIDANAQWNSDHSSVTVTFPGANLIPGELLGEQYAGYYYLDVQFTYTVKVNGEEKVVSEYQSVVWKPGN